MVQNDKITDYLKEHVKDVVDSLGYEFVGLEFGQEGSRSVLRVYIDSLGGIIVKDCEVVSKKISRFLDEDTMMPDSRFFLEVSSPGLDRPLFTIDDYKRFVGQLVKVKLDPSVKGRKKYRGVLTGVSGNIVHIKDDSGETCDISFQTILKGNIIFQG